MLSYLCFTALSVHVCAPSADQLVDFGAPVGLLIPSFFNCLQSGLRGCCTCPASPRRVSDLAERLLGCSVTQVVLLRREHNTEKERERERDWA